MSEIEKIKRYIKRTGVQYEITSPYHIDLQELVALRRMAENALADAIYLAFEYGRAKGERSARATQKRMGARA